MADPSNPSGAPSTPTTTISGSDPGTMAEAVTPAVNSDPTSVKTDASTTKTESGIMSLSVSGKDVDATSSSKGNADIKAIWAALKTDKQKYDELAKHDLQGYQGVTLQSCYDRAVLYSQYFVSIRAAIVTIKGRIPAEETQLWKVTEAFLHSLDTGLREFWKAMNHDANNLLQKGEYGRTSVLLPGFDSITDKLQPNNKNTKGNNQKGNSQKGNNNKSDDYQDNNNRIDDTPKPYDPPAFGETEKAVCSDHTCD
jgi:hypothetical protein